MTEEEYLNKVLDSIEERIDGVWPQVITIPGYPFPIDLENCTNEDLEVLHLYFGSVH